MRYSTFQVPTPAGPLIRIGADLDGRLVDLTAAAAAVFGEQGEPDAAEYAAFLVPPDMITFLRRGAKAAAAAEAGLRLAAEANARTVGGREGRIDLAHGPVLLAPRCL